MHVYSRTRTLELFLLLFVVASSGCGTACPPKPATGFAIHGMPGPEDFEIQTTGPGAPRLLVSSQERSEKEPEPGHIFSLSLASDGADLTPRPLVLTNREHCSFHPHGISLVTRQDGKQRLYVINHHDACDTNNCSCTLKNLTPADKGKEIHSVEVYELLDGGTWTMVDRLTDPLFLTHPNDVAASPDGFVYVTNAPVTKGGFLFEALIGHSSSSVVVFDEEAKKWYRVAGRPRIANGIAVDWPRKRLYVAETGRGRIDVLAMDGRGGPTAPVHVGTIDIGSGVDNLSWEPPGPDSRTLWVAADPNLFAFFRLGMAYKWAAYRHKKEVTSRSASEVYRISVNGDSGTSTPGSPAFCDDGARISGASTAVKYEGSLFISQVFGDFVLRLPYP
jgi:arylesterase/paraoxonase